MSMILDGTNGVTYNDSSLQAAAASPYGLKNRIINGDMRIDQRNAGASVTPSTTTDAFPVDRWTGQVSQNSKLTMQQNAGSVTPPTSFTNYAGVTSSSAYSIATGDYFLFSQQIEGLNVSDLAWGTANAKTLTLSFQVYSSLTGTFGGVISNSAQNRSYPFSYSIPVANTWTTISITIAGDTSGTWLTTNGVGIRVRWGLGVGSTYSGTAGAWSGSNLFSATGATSVVGTNGATWYVTGIQLEIGSTATPFERRMYGQELALCQRYLPAWVSTSTADMVATMAAINTTTGWAYFVPIVQPRVAPTGVTATASELNVRSASSSNVTCTAVSLAAASQYMFLLNITVGSGVLVANAAGHAYLNASGAKILWTGCEL